MKEQTKKKMKTAAIATGAVLSTTYLIMRHIAKKQYPDSVYANQPEEQNPVQGRKVVFVENANDPVNADGKQTLRNIYDNNQCEKSDRMQLKAFFNSLDESVEYSGHIIMTHERFLCMNRNAELLKNHRVIIDEDILRSVYSAV